MKNRKILVKIPQGLDRQKAYRARRGIGSMSDLAPVVPGAALITMAGGVRAASRVSGLSTDTVMATGKGAGSLRSYMKLAQALGMAVKVEAGKSDRWKTLHSSDFMAWETPPGIWMGVLGRLGVEAFHRRRGWFGEGLGRPCLGQSALWPGAGGLGRQDDRGSWAG